MEHAGQISVLRMPSRWVTISNQTGLPTQGGGNLLGGTSSNERLEAPAFSSIEQPMSSERPQASQQPSVALVGKCELPCNICGRGPFRGKAGLAQHKRKAHTEE